MFSNEDKEVTKLLFCKQMIRILIASNIEFVTSKMKPIFDVLIKLQLPWDQKHLPILIHQTFHHSVFPCLVQRREIQLTNKFPQYSSQNLKQTNRKQHDNWYVFSISVKLKLSMWFWDQIEIPFPF